MQILAPRLTRPTKALLAVALCAIGLCTLATEPSSAAGRYVAFGDSGQTGSGLGAEYPGSRHLCWQTVNSYPVFIADALNITDFASAACSAAWVNDLTTTQSLYDANTGTYPDTAPPQLDALNGSETLVSLGIGDNDSGYGDIVNDCLGNTTSATPCKNKYLTGGVNYFVNRAQTLLSGPLGDAIDEIHRRAPKAEVWVIGYPRLFPEDVSNCPGKIGISAGDAPVVNAWQHAVNDTEKATAEAHDAYYVDVFSQSTGHDACQSNAADRWDNPEPAATPSGWSLHPTLAGHTAVANLFATALASPRPIRPVRNNPAIIGQTLSIKLAAKKVRSVTSKLAPITTKSPSRNGAKLSVTLARTGTVEFFIDRASPGHIKNGKCRALSKRASKGRKTCTRYRALSSSIALSLPGGGSTVYFTGRAGGKRLPEGKYRLRASLGSLAARTPTFKLSH